MHIVRKSGYDGPSVRRRLLLVVFAVLALPALALAAATDPTKQINPVDQRKAASIVLKRTDLAAGWKKVANAPDSGDELNCPGYNPDESDLILTGESETNFESGAAKISSYSSIYKTRREALASWTRAVKPALAPCVARVIKQGIEATGGKVAIVRHGQIAFPKLAPRTAAYRVAFNVSYTSSGKTTTVPFTLHLIALGNGRGDASLLTIGFQSGVPSADLRALAKLAATRLAAAKL